MVFAFWYCQIFLWFEKTTKIPFAQLQIPAEQIIAYVLLSYAQFIRFSKL